MQLIIDHLLVDHSQLFALNKKL